MRRPEGIAGFAIRSDGPESWLPSATLLDGAIGVALALLAAIQPVEPAWDRLLLCDVPTRKSSVA
jgi:hypothetical protein